MTIAVILSLLVIPVGESLSVEIANSSGVPAKKIEHETGEKISKSDNAVNSFETLLEEVLKNNPELKFFESEILIAEGARKTAGLWNNPEVSSSVGRKRVISSSEDGGSSTARGSAVAITVMQSIEWPGRIRLRKAIADRDIELAKLGLEQFRALLKARSKMAVYALNAARIKEEAAKGVSEHFGALREVLKQRDQAGLTPLLEARVIEAIELNMQRKASQASLEAKSALFDLNQLRGAPPEDSLTLTRINLKFNLIGIDKNELFKFASENNFQVRLRTIELERQGYRVRLAKNERFPDVTAGPAIAMERAGDKERIIGAAISIPFPLWDRNQGNVAMTRAQQTQAGTSLDVTLRDAERRIIEAVTTYEAKLSEMAKWRPDSIQHFKEAAELADRHYRLGAVPVSTYIELQSQYLDTIEGLQDTKKEALEAATQLEFLTGANLSLIETSGGNAL